MKVIRDFKDNNERVEAQEMYSYIMTIIKGTRTFVNGGITERFRQFCTWGAKSFYLIVNTENSVGIQFSVTGLKHKGRVRIYYNRGTDLFEIELLKPRKDECVKNFDDVYLEDLQYILHSNIERDDDMRL